MERSSLLKAEYLWKTDNTVSLNAERWYEFSWKFQLSLIEMFFFCCLNCFFESPKQTLQRFLTLHNRIHIIKRGSFKKNAATESFGFFATLSDCLYLSIPAPLSPVLRSVPGGNWVIFSSFEHCLRQAAVSRWPPAIVWAAVFLSC